MRYAEGTELRQEMPWGLYVGGRALCADGRVRALARISSTAGSFDEIPASVKVKGKTVSGYVTTQCSVETEDDPTVRFIACNYGKNANLLNGEQL